MKVAESQSGHASRPLNVLAVEPFYGGSHRAFLDAVVRQSRHSWKLITGSPRHWKWRMRNAPVALAHQLIDELAKSSTFDDRLPDLIFCSDMLDLPQWRGFLCRPNTFGGSMEPRVSKALLQIASLPAISYFHENQWTYPQAPQARDDAHYGYTNLLTALASEETWFNSQFHQQSFLNASREFISRMPDEREQHDLDELESRCHVVPPGFDPIGTPPDQAIATEEYATDDNPKGRHALRIGWASRWEHDKRPDRFEQLLRDGVVADQAELARLGHVSRARVSQILALLQLAPDIQEAILFLPPTERGRDPVTERDLRPIAAVVGWRGQRGMWQELNC